MSGSLWLHGPSSPGLPDLHHLLEFAQTHVHWVSDAIQPFHPLSPSSPLALHLFQHQGFFFFFNISVQFSRSVMSDSWQPHELQHARPLTSSRSLLKLMSIESVMPSCHLFLCCPLLLLPSIFPSIRLFTSDGQSIGASALASVLRMNIQGWFPLRLTDLISLLSKGLSRVFSSTTVQKHQFFSA